MPPCCSGDGTLGVFDVRTGKMNSVSDYMTEELLSAVVLKVAALTAQIAVCLLIRWSIMLTCQSVVTEWKQSHMWLTGRRAHGVFEWLLGRLFGQNTWPS